MKKANKIDKPRNSREYKLRTIWYTQGLREGLEGRTKEIAENKARADAKWAEINICRERLKGIQTIARTLHDLVEAAGIERFR